MPSSLLRRPSRVAVLVASSLAALSVLSGCGSSSSDRAGATAPTTATGTVVEALDFRAPLVGGGTFDGADHAGRPVAFWFWAPT